MAFLAVGGRFAEERPSDVCRSSKELRAGLSSSSGRRLSSSMNSPRRLRSERLAGTASGELMGRTPVVKELGPGGGVGTMVRSESVSALLFVRKKKAKRTKNKQKKFEVSKQRVEGCSYECVPVSLIVSL